MPDLTEVIEQLEGFRSHPPVGPTPVATLTDRGRRRRRRRAAARGTAIVAVLAVGAGLVATRDGRDGSVVVGEVPASAPDGPATVPSSPVSTTASPSPDPSTSTSSTTATTPETAPAGAVGLVVEPSTGLVGGERVDIQVVDPPDEALAVRQCAAEVLDEPLPGRNWCDSVGPYVLGGETAFGPFAVERVIDTGRNGIVDCASLPRRCVLVVRPSSTTSTATRADDLVAPLEFAPGLPPIPTPTLDVGQGTVDEGATVTVAGTGFVAGERVVLQLCVAGPLSDDLDCDLARTRPVAAAADGTFSAPFRVWTEILTYRGWVPCDPCQVWARAIGVARVAAPVTVVPADPPERPTVRIVEPGPYEPGQLVTLVGDGYQVADDHVAIAWCRVGEHTCPFPAQGFVPSTDATGSFTIEGYPLPDNDFVDASACREAPGCVLVDRAGEGAPNLVEVPLVFR
jgi:hypothetical protein